VEQQWTGGDSPIAAPKVGNMTFATILTLIVNPGIYTPVKEFFIRRG
jgi:Cu/Ag efflux pump CusA